MPEESHPVFMRVNDPAADWHKCWKAINSNGGLSCQMLQELLSSACHPDALSGMSACNEAQRCMQAYLRVVLKDTGALGLREE